MLAIWVGMCYSCYKWLQLNHKVVIISNSNETACKTIFSLGIENTGIDSALLQ